MVSAGSGGLRVNPAVCTGSATATQHQGAWGAGTGKDRHGMTSLGLGFTAPSCARSAPAWVSVRCQGWSQLCALELGGGWQRLSQEPWSLAASTRAAKPLCSVYAQKVPWNASSHSRPKEHRPFWLPEAPHLCSPWPLPGHLAQGSRGPRTPRGAAVMGGAEPAAAPRRAQADHSTPQPLLASGCLVASPMAGLCPGCRSEGSPGPALSHHVWPPAQRDRAWH